MKIQKNTNWDKFIGVSLYSIGLFKGYQKFFPYLKKDWPQKGAKVLELGSGTGRLSLWFSKKFPVSEIVLVDFNEKLLDKSRKIFAKQNIKVRFIKEDIRSLDLKEKFYLVHSAGVIEHFSKEDQKKILEVYRHHCHRDGWAIAYAPTPTKSYKFWRGIQEIVGCWRFPDETPILKKELIQLFQNFSFNFIASNKVWNFYLTECGILTKLFSKNN